jgi:two-component system cell cycle sensor histidine kinase/response regulator CckA
MRGPSKTKGQLIKELNKPRQRIIEQNRLIDRKKQAEKALRKSESYYRTLLENLPQKIFLKDKNSVYLSCNENYSRDLKIRPHEITGKTDYDFFPRELAKKYRADDKRIMESRKTVDIEERYIQDGKEVIVHTVKTPIKDKNGKIVGILGVFWDITKRKREEDDLRKYRRQLEEMVEKRTVELRMVNEQLQREITERRRTEEVLREYQRAIEGSQDIIAVVDQDYNYLLANKAFLKYRSMDGEQVIGRSVPEVLGKDVFEMVVKKNLDTCFQGEVVQYEMKYVYPEFGERDLLVSHFPIEGPNGVNRVASVIQDITERKRTENALRESEKRYRALFEGSRDAIYITVREGEIVDANQSMLDLFGYSREEIIGLNARKTYVHPEDRKKFQQEIEREGFVRDYEIKLRRKDGTEMVCLLTATVRQANDGNIVGYQGILRDITEHKQVLNELHTEKQRFQTLSENAPFGMVMIDKDGAFRYINPKFRELFGYDLNDVPNGKTWFRKAYPDTRYRHDVISAWINDLESSNPGEKRSRTFTVTCKDGREKIINFIPVQLDAGENLMACEDITERERTEIEMAALQEQLRQSQKMEAIGRLAGGIAHDFNNLLTVIRGYSQLLLVEHKEGTSLEGNIEQIKQAADRATDLTRQLLAFGRRQLMEMRVLDLNTVLRNLDKMLRRVLGEDVRLVTVLAEDLGRVKTDPGQMEQVVMNLAVNARDAMPSGGRLTIETANVELDEAYARAHISVLPGRYVMLSVSDTGVGMTQEVKERAFEPFFTTKEKGKGTGLGLSTVYGIVKQSGGNIWVYSEPGKGTTFKIYLQRVDEPLEELREKMVGEELPRGKETVLVVEDEEKVRKLIVEILERQGYRVLEASDGDEALLIHEKHDGPIHLILVDVVMPGMSGSELAKRLASLRPDTKILYMSGYTDNAIVHHGVLAQGVNYIQKPFTMEGLTRKVRQVLDKDSRPAG